MSLDVTFEMLAEPPTAMTVSPFKANVLVKDQHGEVILDRRGDDALLWPGCLMELPPFQRREFTANLMMSFVNLLATREVESRQRKQEAKQANDANAAIAVNAQKAAASGAAGAA